MFPRYPAMMHLQERMCNASSGRKAYSIYLGRNGTHCSISPLRIVQSVIPDIADVFHFGLSRSSWSNKAIVPTVEDGVFLQLLLVLLEVIEYITEIKLKSGDSSAFYCTFILDQKATPPVAALYDEKIYGIIISLSHEDVHIMCKHGISPMLNYLISKFNQGELKWVKETEVYMVQFLDIPVAVNVASYYLENTGDSNDVKLHIEEVLLYVQACENCLLNSVKSGQIPFCMTQF